MERARESLRIFCRNKKKSKLLAQKDIADHEVKVAEPYTRPKAKSSPRGIIFDVNLDMEEDEIIAATPAWGWWPVRKGKQARWSWPSKGKCCQNLHLWVYAWDGGGSGSKHTYQIPYGAISANTMGTRLWHANNRRNARFVPANIVPETATSSERSRTQNFNEPTPIAPTVEGSIRHHTVDARNSRQPRI